MFLFSKEGEGRGTTLGPVELRRWLAVPGSAGYFRTCLRTTQSSRVGPRRLRLLTIGAPPQVCAPSVVLAVAVRPFANGQRGRRGRPAKTQEVDNDSGQLLLMYYLRVCVLTCVSG